jgi:hypothetical protein
MMFALLTGLQLWIVGLAALGVFQAVVIGVVLWVLMHRREVARHRFLLELHNSLQQYGFTLLGKIAESLALEDWGGALQEAAHLKKMLADPITAVPLMLAVGLRQVPLLMDDAAFRLKLLKAIADWVAANPALMTATGYALTSPPAAR